MTVAIEVCFIVGVHDKISNDDSDRENGMIVVMICVLV